MNSSLSKLLGSIAGFTKQSKMKGQAGFLR
jgi:hypothetical protein